MNELVLIWVPEPLGAMVRLLLTFTDKYPGFETPLGDLQRAG